MIIDNLKNLFIKWKMDADFSEDGRRVGQFFVFFKLHVTFTELVWCRSSLHSV